MPKKGWSKAPAPVATKEEIKRNRYESLKAYLATVEELKEQIKTLRDEVSGLEEKRGLKSAQIAGEIRQVKQALKSKQEELDKLVGQNRIFNRSLTQERKDTRKARDDAKEAELKAEKQRKSAIRQIAENDQRVAEENKKLKEREEKVDIRKREQDQRDFEFEKRQKALEVKREELGKDKADFDDRNFKLKNVENLAQARNEIADKKMAEAEKAERDAERAQKTADDLMAKANKEMADVLKKEEIASKKEAILKERDKSLDKLNAELKEKQISQAEYDRLISLNKREVDNKIGILNKLRKEDRK